MATKKQPSAPTSSPAQPSGFGAWQQARRDAEVSAALQWRADYLAAIATEVATRAQIKALLDGQAPARSLWKHLADARGRPFTSFAAFCEAAPPEGLGTPPADLARLRRGWRARADLAPR